MSMRRFINLVEDHSVQLFHGTTIDRVESILENGLEARVGEFVSHFYDEDSDIESLVFAADRAGLKKCINAMAHLIWQKTGNRTASFQEPAIREYGALLVIDADLNRFEHRPVNDDNEYGQHPTAVEPGDYYSRDDVAVERVIVGDELIAFLKQHNLLRESSIHEVKRSPLNAASIIYHGTTKERVKQMNGRIEPRVGELVRSVYPRAKVSPVVFAADENGKTKVFSAIRFAVAQELGIHKFDVTIPQFVEHAAILKIETDRHKFDQTGQYHKPQRGIEKHDYYSYEPTRIDGVITGEAVIDFFGIDFLEMHLKVDTPARQLIEEFDHVAGLLLFEQGKTFVELHDFMVSEDEEEAAADILVQVFRAADARGITIITFISHWPEYKFPYMAPAEIEAWFVGFGFKVSDRQSGTMLRTPTSERN